MHSSVLHGLIVKRPVMAKLSRTQNAATDASFFFEEDYRVAGGKDHIFNTKEERVISVPALIIISPGMPTLGDNKEKIRQLRYRSL